MSHTRRDDEIAAHADGISSARSFNRKQDKKEQESLENKKKAKKESHVTKSKNDHKKYYKLFIAFL